MGRLPFDPLKTAAASKAVTAPPLTITQLAARIAASLTAGFPTPVRFIGEVSGFRERTHWYFDLKDAGAVINCVCFASGAKKLGFVPGNGQQVIARGRVDFYAAGGKVSVIVDSLEPVGAGALDVAYKALCEELRSLGWFAPERKRSLPTFPRRVAVITSRTGAALQDVLVTMQKRCPAVGVVIVDARVQGAAAVPEVIAAITYISQNAARLGIDAVLVTRGGGSMEDLWCFNDRGVAKAILDSAVPVVAAIGHETDTTIAELVADERCSTPTQAAVRLTPDREALNRQTASISSRLTLLMQRMLTMERSRFTALASRPALASPAGALLAPKARVSTLTNRLTMVMREQVLNRNIILERLRSRLVRLRPAELAARARVQQTLTLTRISGALHSAMQHRLQLLGGGVDSLERQLHSLGPAQVLARGYSVTTDRDGVLVRSSAKAPPGTELTTRWIDGAVTSIVRGEGRPDFQTFIAAPPPPRVTGKSRASKARDNQTPGLFGG